MSLQDDIPRYAREGNAPEESLADRIAAGIQRDYHLVKLTDLPEVTRVGHHLYSAGDEERGCSAINWEYAQQRAITYLAVALHLQSRESEAAALEARRDELVREYFPLAPSYSGMELHHRNVIDALATERDRAAAAEAEVARLRGERS